MPSTYVLRKNEITQVNDTCKGKISLIGMLGTLTDPSKLHLLHFGYWWLNLSFLLEDALATFGNGFPCSFTNMGLKTPTSAHGTF